MSLPAGRKSRAADRVYHIVDWGSHRRWRRALEAWVDGEVRPEVEAAVLEHLGRCSRCGHEAVLMSATKMTLRHGRAGAALAGIVQPSGRATR